MPGLVAPTKEPGAVEPDQQAHQRIDLGGASDAAAPDGLVGVVVDGGERVRPPGDGDRRCPVGFAPPVVVHASRSKERGVVAAPAWQQRRKLAGQMGVVLLLDEEQLVACGVHDHRRCAVGCVRGGSRWTGRDIPLASLAWWPVVGLAPRACVSPVGALLAVGGTGRVDRCGATSKSTRPGPHRRS